MCLGTPPPLSNLIIPWTPSLEKNSGTAHTCHCCIFTPFNFSFIVINMYILKEYSVHMIEQAISRKGVCFKSVQWLCGCFHSSIAFFLAFPSELRKKLGIFWVFFCGIFRLYKTVDYRGLLRSCNTVGFFFHLSKRPEKLQLF